MTDVLRTAVDVPTILACLTMTLLRPNYGLSYDLTYVLTTLPCILRTFTFQEINFNVITINLIVQSVSVRKYKRK